MTVSCRVAKLQNHKAGPWIRCQEINYLACSQTRNCSCTRLGKLTSQNRGQIRNTLFRKTDSTSTWYPFLSWGWVAHTCNSSSRGRDKDNSSRPAWAKSETLYQK
jgi:hypothetical protein